MPMYLELIQYDRPLIPVPANNIMQILAIKGKDVIRLAWSSLNPNEDNNIRTEALAAWFCEFFNLIRNEGQGNLCISRLCDMNILRKSYAGTYVRPEFKL